MKGSSAKKKEIKNLPKLKRVIDIDTKAIDLSYKRTVKKQKIQVSVKSSSESVHTEIDTELSEVDKGWDVDSETEKSKTEKSNSMSSENFSSSDTEPKRQIRKRRTQEQNENLIKDMKKKW